MAEKLKAIINYRPRIKRGQLAGLKEVADLISGRTSINPGKTQYLLMEFSYVVTFYLALGRSVQLPGIGIFSPSIALDGTIKVNLKADKALTKELNERPFKGKITNKDNIGKTQEQLIALWNKDYPNDLIEL